jgi:hypothetical protein
MRAADVMTTAAAENASGVKRVSDHLFVLAERIRGGPPDE